MIARPKTYGKYTGQTSSTSSGTHGSTANNKAAVNGFYRGRAILAHNIQGHPLVTQTVASNNRAPTETYTNMTQPTLGYSSKPLKTLPLFTTDELIIIGIVVIFVIAIIAVVLIHG